MYLFFHEFEDVFSGTDGYSPKVKYSIVPFYQ